jgi:hypothetical protein
MVFRSCDELLSKAFPADYAEGPELEPRFVLLTRLGRDLSQYYLCYACLQLPLWTHQLTDSTFQAQELFRLA